MSCLSKHIVIAGLIFVFICTALTFWIIIFFIEIWKSSNRSFCPLNFFIILFIRIGLVFYIIFPKMHSFFMFICNIHLFIMVSFGDTIHFWICKIKSLHSVCVLIMSHTHFRVNLHSVVVWISKELLTWSMPDIWSLSNCNRIWTRNLLFLKWTLNNLAKLAKWWNVCLQTKWLWVLILLQSFKLLNFEIHLSFISKLTAPR